MRLSWTVSCDLGKVEYTFYRLFEILSGMGSYMGGGIIVKVTVLVWVVAVVVTGGVEGWMKRGETIRGVGWRGEIGVKDATMTESGQGRFASGSVSSDCLGCMACGVRGARAEHSCGEGGKERCRCELMTVNRGQTRMCDIERSIC
eukprot:TRINITY_DN6204_c0_g1_i7.p1 TRINITY_DN6204_c0_g1~~TRINITY_DN6204_c0_g1_i7.p1  ORF type:complete len:146 (-),score=13.97 TRINITY_DN6204_c0_g1_i7:318-755(-)